MVDVHRLRDLLDRLAARVEQLGELAGTDRAVLADDPIRLAAVKYLFIEAIQVAIDIGNHVIASEGLRAPDSFADVFTSLAEGGWVPDERRAALEELARFRNVLVHLYDRVDDERVLDALSGSLDDLRAYRGAVIEGVEDADDG